MKSEESLLVYAWLVRAFQNSKGMTFERMNEKWMEDKEFSDGVEMTYSMFHRHKTKLAQSLGVFISYDFKRKVYFMENKEPLRGKELIGYMFQATMVSRALQSLAGLERRVALQNFSLGHDVIMRVGYSIRENREVIMSYLAQDSDKVKEHHVLPYGLKMYNGRTYMIGKIKDGKRGDLIPFELDRIRSYDITSKMFNMPADFDIHEYYFHYFGVFRDENVPPEEVEIWTFGNTHRYLQEVPLHHSQQEIKHHNTDYHKYKLFLSPTNDFIGEVIRHAERIKVVKPAWLVAKVKARIDKMKENYHE